MPAATGTSVAVVPPRVQVDPEEDDSEVPVTLVSGFNGSGKTFVLRHLLRHKCTDADEISPEELRVGVVCATNTDAKLLRRKEKEVLGKDVIRSTHSCPCCVEEKLSKDLASLIQQGEEDDHESPIDRVLVECGWASPRTLRNRLQEAKEQGIEDAQKFVVDSMVSVVDASKIRELWETTDILADRTELDGFAESNLNGPPVAGAENYAKRRVSEMLAEQLECADVVVLTKMELVPPEQRDFLRALLRLLLPPNPGSLVVPVESGADPSPHLAERVWIDSDWERTVATNTNEDDYKDCVARAKEAPHTREELLWWPPTALSKLGSVPDTPLTIQSCADGMQVSVLQDETACRAAVKACDGLEEGSWEFDLMDQRLGAKGRISEVEHEDAIVEVNFGRWDERVGMSTFVYVQRRPFHPTRLEAVVKELPTALGCPFDEEDAEKDPVEEEEVEKEHPCFESVVRSKGFVWLATFHTAALYWDHSGGHFSLINIGQWWAATDGGMEGHSDEFDGEFGDRRQELVFIGVNLDQAAIEAVLDSCLLDDKELGYYRQHFMSDKPSATAGPPGPLPGMPSAVPARTPDDRDPQKRGTAMPASAATATPHGAAADEPIDRFAEKASALSRHEEGNNAFRREEYKLAVKLYSQAIGLCEGASGAGNGNHRAGRRVDNAPPAKPSADESETPDELLDRKGTLLSNRAECYLRTQNFQKAVSDCEAALSLGIPNWPKKEKTEQRRQMAADKLGAENTEQAKQAEHRRATHDKEKKKEQREKEKEAKRAAQREADSLVAEAKRIEAELARDQEAEEERERQRKERAEKRDTTQLQEKLNEAKALWDKAEAQMKEATRHQRSASEMTVAAERRQTELKKKEGKFKDKEMRVADTEKTMKQKQRQIETRAKQLETQEAKLSRDRAEFQTEIQRTRQELSQREERVRAREQQIERQRAGANKHDKDLQAQERHQKDADRALKDRKRRLDGMQEALEKMEHDLREKDQQRPVDAKQQPQPQQQQQQQQPMQQHRTNGSPGPKARTGLGGMGKADEQSWPTSPPLGPTSPSVGQNNPADMNGGVSRFFPAPQQADTPTQQQQPGQLPKSYCCPITQQLMREPVVACDGHTYEHKAIESWLSQKHISPITGERMNDHTVVPNRLLQNQIAQFVANNQSDGGGPNANRVSPNASPMESNGFDGGLGLTPGPPVRPMALGTSLFGQVGGSSQGGAPVPGPSGLGGGGFGHSLGGSGGGGEPAAPFGQDPLLGLDMLRWQNDIDSGLGRNADDHDTGWSTSSLAALQALEADEIDGMIGGDNEDDSDDEANPGSSSHAKHTHTQHSGMGAEFSLTAQAAMNGDELDPLAIYVSNINWETTSSRLREVFTQSFGAVAHVNLKENKVRRGPSYAFIIFELPGSAQKAILQGSMNVDGRPLKFEARRLQQKPQVGQAPAHGVTSSRLLGTESKSALVERVGGIRTLDPKIGLAVPGPPPATQQQRDQQQQLPPASSGSGPGSSVTEPEQSNPEQLESNPAGTMLVGGDGERPPLVVKPGCRLFVGLGGGATGEEQRTQLARLFSNYGKVADVEVGFMGCAFVTMTHEDHALACKRGLHATTPPISGLARKQGLAVEVATHKGYETALKKAGKPIPPATAL